MADDQVGDKTLLFGQEACFAGSLAVQHRFLVFAQIAVRLRRRLPLQIIGEFLDPGNFAVHLVGHENNLIRLIGGQGLGQGPHLRRIVGMGK